MKEALTGQHAMLANCGSDTLLAWLQTGMRTTEQAATRSLVGNRASASARLAALINAASSFPPADAPGVPDTQNNAVLHEQQIHSLQCQIVHTMQEDAQNKQGLVSG